MDNPLSSPDSQHNSQNEPATDKTSSGLNKTVKFDESQIITKPAEESGPQELKEQTEDNVTQDLNEPVKFSKSEITVEPAKESGPQKLNEQAKDSVPEDNKPQVNVEPPEESTPQNLNEQAKDSEPQDRPTRDHSLQDMNEVDVGTKSLTQIAQDRTVPELKNETEAKEETPEKTLLDQEESPLPSSFSGQEVIPTGDIPAPGPILDGSDRGLPEQAIDNEPRVIEAQEKTVVEETEQQPQYKKEGPPQIIITPVQEKTLKTEKAEVPSLHGKKPSSPSSSYRSLFARPAWSRNPSQLAKAALHPKPMPQTANKATQILPGRVPMLAKVQPKRVLTPKPKPPSADKATEISPSFERLLRRPPLLVKKKKKKEETSPATMVNVWPQKTSSSSVCRPVSSRRGRSFRAAAVSPALHVKSTKKKPLHVKSTKSAPLRVKFSSSSPNKHLLNLSYSPRKKRKIICNLCITFCDNWEEPRVFHGQQTHWEESLASCSGLYRACSVFSTIKDGRIHVSDLLLTLHTLGILVTSEEMHHILCFVNVDGHKCLNFSEFLEAVNATSPFAETEGFQNVLWAFRKMKRGTVAVEELEFILQYLGITLSPEIVQQTLGCTKVNKNGKFSISDFLTAAKDVQRILEEEDEAFLNEHTVFKRRPFQEVADLIDAECRHRRKYCDCFDEMLSTPTCHVPLLTWRESEKEVALGKQGSRTSSVNLRQSSSASSVNVPKEESKHSATMDVPASQMSLSSDFKSHESPANNTQEGNKDDDSMGLKKSQLDLFSQDIEDPVPS